MHFRFPEFLKPNAFSFEIFNFSLSLTWYSLSYIFGIICAWYLIYSIAKKQSLWHERSPLNTQNVEDLMTAFLYLSSDYSKYTTGQNIIIDGGLSLK